MKYYAVAEMDVTDPGWVARLRRQRHAAWSSAAAGATCRATVRIKKIEGERAAPQVIVLIEWPSKEVAEEFYDSEEYRPYREARGAGARNEFLLVAGEDVNGVARIGR